MDREERRADGALSAPAVSPMSVGVARGMSFAVYQRADGAEVASPVASISALQGLVKGMVA